jgi:hypothetical protein
MIRSNHRLNRLKIGMGYVSSESLRSERRDISRAVRERVGTKESKIQTVMAGMSSEVWEEISSS